MEWKTRLNIEMNELSQALTEESQAVLSKIASGVSARYRGDHEDLEALALTSQDEVQAYVAWRLPVTAMALAEVLGRLKEHLPNFQPQRVVDLGAGPATSVLPLVRAYQPDLIELVEAQQAMQEGGQALLEALGPDLGKTRVRWLSGKVPQVLPGGADLLISAYVLNEWSPAEIQDFARRLAKDPPKVAAFLFPGTPLQFEKFLVLRDEFMALGFPILAPCPGNINCPMSQGDWCHFTSRVQRSGLLRRIKSGDLAYEDEKFSYLIIAPGQAEISQLDVDWDRTGRILRHPVVRKKLRQFVLCSQEGIRQVDLTKGKHPEAYKQSAKLAWGDLLVWEEGK